MVIVVVQRRVVAHDDADDTLVVVIVVENDADDMLVVVNLVGQDGRGVIVVVEQNVPTVVLIERAGERDGRAHSADKGGPARRLVPSDPPDLRRADGRGAVLEARPRPPVDLQAALVAAARLEGVRYTATSAGARPGKCAATWSTRVPIARTW
jgi:hypothetical protein